MNLNEILARRVSAHHFAKGDIAVSDIQSVITQTLRTPTAFNLQNWHFSIVASEQGKEALCQAAWGQGKVLEAAAVVVISGDLQAYRKLAEKLRPDVDKGAVSAEMAQSWVEAARQNFEHNQQAQREEAIRSASLAAMTLMLAATERGWASCPMSGFDPEAVRRVCGLPENFLPVLLVALGLPDGSGQVQKSRIGVDEVTQII